MENDSLTALFEAERDRLLSEMERDRTPQAAQAALEKAVDRLALRHAEQCSDEQTRMAAQLTLRTIRQALPLMDSVGEVRHWQREASPPQKRSLTLVAVAPLIAGIVLILATMLGLMFAGRQLPGLVTLVSVLFSAALGMAALFWAGMKYAAPQAVPIQDGPTRDEYLVDCEKVWHHLYGILLAADSALEELRGRAKPAVPQVTAVAGTDALPRAEAELFSGLLESAYAMDGPDAREMIERMRFYLHGAKVEVLDYEQSHDAWFEVLPAYKAGTIRPALVSGDKLICKGLAAR